MLPDLGADPGVSSASEAARAAALDSAGPAAAAGPWSRTTSPPPGTAARVSVPGLALASWRGSDAQAVLVEPAKARNQVAHFKSGSARVSASNAETGAAW